MNTKLRGGETGFIGVTTDATPHVVYYVKNGANYDVEAAPVAGGAAIVLQASIADADNAYVSGGAVAWFAGTDGATGLATTINVWTKATGKKTVVTPTRDGLFAASSDGTRVAFGTNSAADTTDLAVTTSAAPSAATPALAADNAVNQAAITGNKCPARFGFAGTTLVAAYCTGVDAAATQPKLVTVAAAGAAVVRIDNALPADAIQTTWFADNSGTKLFVLGPAPTNEGRVVVTTAGATTVAAVDPGVTAVDVAKDGSAVVYLAGGALKKATFAAVPVVTPIVPTGVVALLGMTADSKRALFNTLETADKKLSDLKTVDVTAAVPAPVTLVATPTTSPIAFNGAGTQVLYLEEKGMTTSKLKTKPVGGGAEKVLDPASYAAFPSPSGTGVLTVSALTQVGGGGGDLNLTLKFVDSVAGGALKPAASDVLYSQQGATFAWSGKSFVHTNISAAAPGMYAVTLP